MDGSWLDDEKNKGLPGGSIESCNNLFPLLFACMKAKVPSLSLWPTFKVEPPEAMQIFCPLSVWTLQ